MKFLEKDLEDIIYENPRYCWDNGLFINCCYENARMLRQVKLGKYGIADLVSIGFYDNKPGAVYNPFTEDYCDKTLFVQIIECKRNQVNMHTYCQAKRYETGIRQLLDKFDTRGINIKIDITLVGRTVETSSDFVYAMQSSETGVFTYSYGPNGILFYCCNGDWEIENGTTAYNSPEVTAKLKDLLDVRFGYDQNLQKVPEIWQFGKFSTR